MRELFNNYDFFYLNANVSEFVFGLDNNSGDLLLRAFKIFFCNGFYFWELIRDCDLGGEGVVGFRLWIENWIDSFISILHSHFLFAQSNPLYIPHTPHTQSKTIAHSKLQQQKKKNQPKLIKKNLEFMRRSLIIKTRNKVE